MFGQEWGGEGGSDWGAKIPFPSSPLEGQKFGNKHEDFIACHSKFLWPILVKLIPYVVTGKKICTPSPGFSTLPTNDWPSSKAKDFEGFWKILSCFLLLSLNFFGIFQPYWLILADRLFYPPPPPLVLIAVPFYGAKGTNMYGFQTTKFTVYESDLSIVIYTK